MYKRRYKNKYGKDAYSIVVKEVDDSKMFTKEALIKSLPTIGTKIIETPTFLTDGHNTLITYPMEGVVTYVNKNHLWYQVEYILKDGTRHHECYKLPHVDTETRLEHILKEFPNIKMENGIPIICVEAMGYEKDDDDEYFICSAEQCIECWNKPHRRT